LTLSLLLLLLLLFLLLLLLLSISIKKGESYAKTITWIRGKVSFAIIRSALLCLRGTRLNKRRTCNIAEIDMDVELCNSRA
jgi:hypothetical protein